MTYLHIIFMPECYISGHDNMNHYLIVLISMMIMMIVSLYFFKNREIRELKKYIVNNESKINAWHKYLNLSIV